MSLRAFEKSDKNVSFELLAVEPTSTYEKAALGVLQHDVFWGQLPLETRELIVTSFVDQQNIGAVLGSPLDANLIDGNDDCSETTSIDIFVPGGKTEKNAGSSHNKNTTANVVSEGEEESASSSDAPVVSAAAVISLLSTKTYEPSTQAVVSHLSGLKMICGNKQTELSLSDRVDSLTKTSEVMLALDARLLNMPHEATKKVYEALIEDVEWSLRECEEPNERSTYQVDYVVSVVPIGLLPTVVEDNHVSKDMLDESSSALSDALVYKPDLLDQLQKLHKRKKGSLLEYYVFDSQKCVYSIRDRNAASEAAEGPMKGKKRKYEHDKMHLLFLVAIIAYSDFKLACSN